MIWYCRMWVEPTANQNLSNNQIQTYKILERLDCKEIKRAATSYDQMRYVKKKSIDKFGANQT